MINHFLKNICLITFALVGPITLPAGGIQRNFNNYNFHNNPKEIIVGFNCSLHAFPAINADKLTVLTPGTLLSILSKWKVDEKENWVRVQIATNHFIDDPNKIIKGWIQI